MNQDLSGKSRTCPQHGTSCPHGHGKIVGAAQHIPVNRGSDAPTSLPATGRSLPIIDMLGTGRDPDKVVHTAAAKKECGMCGYKAAGKGVWECTHSARFPCPNGLKHSRSMEPNWVCPGFLKKPSVPRPPQPKQKGLPVPLGVKFLYIGRPPGLCLHQDLWRHLSLPKTGSRTHQGVVTVAWIEPTPGILHLGFSFCSPEDPWCKATGRDMALARLLHPLVIPYLYSPKKTVHEVARAVLTHDFGRIAALSPGVTMWERVPSWTRGLGKRMEEKERMVGGRIRRLRVPPIHSHAADAFAFMASSFIPPRREGKLLAEVARDFNQGFEKEAARRETEAKAREADRLETAAIQMGSVRHKAAPGSPIDWQRTLRRHPFSDFCIDEAAPIPPEALDSLGKPEESSPIKEIFALLKQVDETMGLGSWVLVPKWTKTTAQQIVARMMRDIVALGKG